MTAARFNALAYGVDDLTLGFDMEGSGSVATLNAAPGSQTRRGKMLGEPASWGKWVHLLGRSVSFWKADTKRLYVQAKLADEGQLCPPREIEGRTLALIERMVAAGVVSYERPWVTRLDVAVDAECESADGKLLLDALEAVRLPNGWRTTSTGSPRSTVYFRARVSEHVHARAYCRNLKTKSGEPYGRIRLEAEQRFDPKECPLEYAEQPAFIATIWKGRYANLASRGTRLAREVQAMELAERMQRGELRHGEAERLHLFLDLERLGLAHQSYRKSVYALRRREAAKLGYSANEIRSDGLDVELADLLAEYVRAVDEHWGCRAASRRMPAACGGPVRITVAWASVAPMSMRARF